VERFDSGWVPGNPTSPEIKLMLSMHELRCFDIVFRVNAIPLEFSRIQNDPRKQLRPLPWRLPEGSRKAETTWGRLKALEPR
jgi:hypothetical protein